jgi:pilus assembly protein Flp/PilA
MSENAKTFLRQYVEDESGISAVEYGLLAAGIAVGLWAFMGDIGESLGTIFSNIEADLSEAAGS